MRRLVLLAAVSTLVACSPPPREAEAPSPAPTPAQFVCNDLAPDLAHPVTLGAEAVAVAALPPELPGGPITPGIYDLTGGALLDAAPAWQSPRAVALSVSESASGVTFNWAEASAGAAPTRWTASFHQDPSPQLAFSCGREGSSPIAFQAQAGDLSLRMPDPSGRGNLFLTFKRRA